MKNWEPLVWGPALAMDSIPAAVCLCRKLRRAQSNDREIKL